MYPERMTTTTSATAPPRDRPHDRGRTGAHATPRTTLGRVVGLVGGAVSPHAAGVAERCRRRGGRDGVEIARQPSPEKSASEKLCASPTRRLGARAEPTVPSRSERTPDVLSSQSAAGRRNIGTKTGPWSPPTPNVAHRAGRGDDRGTDHSVALEPASSLTDARPRSARAARSSRTPPHENTKDHVRRVDDPFCPQRGADRPRPATAPRGVRAGPGSSPAAASISRVSRAYSRPAAQRRAHARAMARSMRLGRGLRWGA